MIISWKRNHDGSVVIWSHPGFQGNSMGINDAQALSRAIREVTPRRVPIGTCPDDPSFRAGTCVDPGIFRHDYIDEAINALASILAAEAELWTKQERQAAEKVALTIGGNEDIASAVKTYLGRIYLIDRQTPEEVHKVLDDATRVGHRAVCKKFRAKDFREWLDFAVDVLLERADLIRIAHAICTPRFYYDPITNTFVESARDHFENLDEIVDEMSKARTDSIMARASITGLYKLATGEHPRLGSKGTLYKPWQHGNKGIHIRMRTMLDLAAQHWGIVLAVSREQPDLLVSVLNSAKAQTV